jgi:hypothetical protein
VSLLGFAVSALDSDITHPPSPGAPHSAIDVDMITNQHTVGIPTSKNGSVLLVLCPSLP